MNYEEAVHRLLSLGKELASPQQARVQKFDLENIRVLSSYLGSPHRALPCAHVAGTNGKGSTSAMLESILRAAGLSTGLFTSPHLEHINERIAFNGEPISDDQFAAAFTSVQSAIEHLLATGELAAHPTYFECLTAMAYHAFAHHSIAFAVYEVGMGGRLDATNLVQPEVAVITQVELDHENFLGHSIEQIASEKAGIIKPGGWVVSSAERPEAREVIRRRATALNAKLTEIDNAWCIEQTFAIDGYYHAEARAIDSGSRLRLDSSLPGRFQIRNALAAATAAQFLAARGFPVSKEAIERGIRETRWPGRLEQLSRNPAIFLDGAHNPAAARELARFWEEHFTNRKIWLIYGAMRDKAVDEIAGLLFPRAHQVLLTRPQQSRAVSARLLAEMTSHLARDLKVMGDAATALDLAMRAAAPEDAIFATGSLYLVGELRSYWGRSQQTAQSRSGQETPILLNSFEPPAV
jgi:dihydrofolate synthase / folylpolyglutamate synthase